MKMKVLLRTTKEQQLIYKQFQYYFITHNFHKTKRLQLLTGDYVAVLF